MYFAPPSSFIKAPTPNLAGVSPLQMTVANFLHPSKQDLPMDITLLPIVASVKDVHNRYLQPIITQYFIDNKSEIWLLFLIAHSKR